MWVDSRPRCQSPQLMPDRRLPLNLTWRGAVEEVHCEELAWQKRREDGDAADVGSGANAAAGCLSC
jgi:hypothetical protein